MDLLKQTLEPFRGDLLTLFWRGKLWPGKGLQTEEGTPLVIRATGKEAVPGSGLYQGAEFKLGKSWVKGDVFLENSSPSLSPVKLSGIKIVLHVSLFPMEKVPDGPVLVAEQFLHPGLKAFLGEKGGFSGNSHNLPGLCGIQSILKGHDVGQLIARAAEKRAFNKSEQILKEADQGIKSSDLKFSEEDEQVLFELIFKSLGYRTYASDFSHIAQTFPLKELEALLSLSPERAREQLLGRWFGFLGLLEKPPEPGLEGETADEFLRLEKVWLATGLAGGGKKPVKKRGRPWNSPERRIAGMFHHLYFFYNRGTNGLLKGWMSLLLQIDGVRKLSNFKKKAMTLVAESFSTPETEFWATKVSFNTSRKYKFTQLVGADRMIVLMANAVIPFFLAYARKKKDKELEKLLYGLYLVLPPEGENIHTKNMSNRLLVNGEEARTLRFQQGLLQIHQDFCSAFETGCRGCELPDLMG